MTDNTVPIDEWLSVISDEYLSTFVKDGGAAVKFVVVAEERRAVLREALKSRCEDLGYVFVTLDAAECRVHMPQDVFFGLASQIDWRLLARRVILISLEKMDYRVDDIDPSDDAINVIEAVARINNLESQSVLFALRPDLEREIIKNPNLTKAFRVAMWHLCEMEGAIEPRHYARQSLLDWLTGADTRIGNVRSFNIYTRIDRTTARYFIESAFHWVRQAGYTGTVLLLDNARVTLTRNPRDGRRYYTKAMTIDHYELLRELIDDVDRLSGALLAVVTDRESIDDEQSKRGYRIYDALWARVMNDVRDRNLVNPVASLVRLS